MIRTADGMNRIVRESQSMLCAEMAGSYPSQPSRSPPSVWRRPSYARPSFSVPRSSRWLAVALPSPPHTIHPRDQDWLRLPYGLLTMARRGLGSTQCRIVSKSQPTLMMIHPMIFTRARVAPADHRHRADRHAPVVLRRHVREGRICA
jgi:hypothetical protein